MKMNTFKLSFTILLSIWVGSVHGDTIKYASSCNVDQCTLSSASNNGGCANAPICYLFQTSINTTLCAPQVTCSLFDPCNSLKRCATNNSVCVINTCCNAPICIPLALASACSMYTNTTNKNPSIVNICPNATWAENGTILPISNNGNYWGFYPDMTVDNNNNLYMIDSANYRILKYVLSNPSVYTVAAVTNSSSPYQASSLFVDVNGTIYTSENAYIPSTMTSSYQISKYNPNGGTSGTVIFGPTTCGANLNQFCGCSSLVVDSTGSIYCSDGSNQRILKITPFATSATIVAGTSGSFGSALNQLNYPSGIYVDGTGALYVADGSNYRVMKFTSGNLVGTILFSLPSYQAPIGLTLDTAGSVYVGTYSGVFKWVPASNSVSEVTTAVNWGVSRVRFDTYGNLYTSGYSSSNIYRYNLTSNIC